MTITQTEAIDGVLHDLSFSSSSGTTYTIADPINADSSSASPYVFEYQYAGTTQPGDMSSRFSGWTAFSAAEAARFEAMLAYVETIANVDFQQVTGQSDPTMNVGKVSLPGSTAGIGGFGYGISINRDRVVTMTDYDNFVVFDNTINLSSGEDHLMLHEILHALALKHTFEGDIVLPPEYENNKYSILSYTPNPDNGLRADGLQLFDIAAVQARWGANMDTATGNDVYTGKRNTTVDAIWDAGGTDTFDASGRTTDVTLSLIEATFSSFDSVDDVAIAYDVVIENAIGGAGNDGIIGNAVANDLAAGAGADTLLGNEGDDTLSGGADDDILLGGDGADVLDGGSGIDRAQYTDATEGVLADLQFSGLNTGFAAGDTYILIEDLYGSTLSDNLRGDAGSNAIWGHSGWDALYGRDGDDTLLGMDGNDRLYGQRGNDALSGGEGSDTLAGGGGADQLTGGEDGDVFDFNDVGESTDGARDTITDFGAGDVINLATIDADTGTGGDQAFSFIGNAAFTSAAGELRFATNGTDGFVLGDVDGDGVHDLNIELLGITSMTAGDFIL